MRRMPRPRRFLLLALGLSLLVVPPACAHQLVVLDGAGEIDAGTGEPARLVHALLATAGDTLTVTVQPKVGAMEAVLYVPDQAPERDLDGRAWPSLELRRTGSGAVTATEDPGSELVVDDATGIAYREVARVPVPRSGPAATIVVHRGAVPARVALRVGQPTPFTTEDADSAPHALQDALRWADTPPPGSHAAKEKARKADRSRVRFAWGGVAITLVALLIAAWWVVRGRRASRRPRP
jgi:hypothetical protein